MGPFANLGEKVAGAWRVMLGRPDGLDRLDLSVEGFWSSFAVIILVAPFAVLGLISQSRLATEPGSGAAPPLADGLGLDFAALLTDWFTFPLVFAALAGPLGLSSRYVPFIVTRNWASLVIAALVSVVHAAHIVGVLPAEAASFVLFAAVAVALRFSYVIARVTLAVSAAAAIPIVIMDFLLSFTIWSAFDQLRSALG